MAAWVVPARSTLAFAFAPVLEHAQAQAQVQVGTEWAVILFLLVVLIGVLATVGLVLWGLYALTKSLLDAEGAGVGAASPPASLVEDWASLADHPEIDATERYGDGAPEVETTVRGRRVVARLETAPGGTDRYVVLQTAMLSVKAGTGFELAENATGRVEYVDRGPDVPTLPDELWSALGDLEDFGGLTVDDRTGVVEHRFPDPEAVTRPEPLRRQADVLVDVVETVEAHVETVREGASDAPEPTVERSER
ncbi:hypothetical protein BRD13_00740 [Halobacteriales archaeon SW_5_70_135]|nr:MAG: hypothetical protein BRD13_00740 [Halobacteriales archaeon SW_5_70_135]